MNTTSMSIPEALRQAAALQSAGRLVEAQQWYEAILNAQPDHFQALQMLGLVLAQRGELEAARNRLTRALAVNPDSAAANSDLGIVLKMMGRLDDALQCLDRAVRLRPDFAEAMTNRAAVLSDARRHAEALASCDRALAIKPALYDGWNNRGVALMGLARYGDALASFDRALTARPGSAEALHNRATALLALSRYAEALASCDRALAVAPNHVDALNTRGVALHQLARFDESIASFDRALALAPAHRAVIQNRISTLFGARRFDAAIPALEQAIALDADVRYAHGLLLHARMNCCDWRGLAAARAALSADVRAGRAGIEPFAYLGICDDPADQLACARIATALEHPPSPTPLWRGERYAYERIRVAYLSADFHEHATAFLLAELFELHDRSRFEVTAVSWGPDSGSAMRARLKRAFEQFIDVRGVSDAEVARLLREREIDIAVDLKGYVRCAAGDIGAAAKPVQVSYLGYRARWGRRTSIT
ncbi:MAG: tetratricopeptide repeat protein [Burkholderiales bacterium]